MRILEQVDNLKPILLMVVVQIAYAGVNVFYKLAAEDGMSLRIIVAYRFIFATAFTAPIALIVERKTRPKLTWMVLFQAFLCGLFGGALAQNLYVSSLALTSASFASAMTNLLPAITFMLALSFRFERIGIGSLAGKAKIMGTLIGIGGAVLLTFLKGPEIDIGSTHIDLLKRFASHSKKTYVPSSHGSRALGAVFAIGSCFSYASWLIVQAKMSEVYPCPYSSTALMSLMGSIQATIVAFCLGKDWSEWKLRFNISLLAVLYSGIVGTGLMVTLINWCVKRKGPVFVSVFNPLMLILVTMAGIFLLNEKLYLGSILGAVVIILGLYVVLWGKSREKKKMNGSLRRETLLINGDNMDIVVASTPERICSGNRDSNNDGHINTKGRSDDSKRTESQ
ncbi:hypothetical protein K2173_015371 [Erythroxylum novogranatense]|uniref:WAT1-related protein n=1 Tax=Erythroxylum novogranatense TaxID=1862640 RepID=A0AAV8SSM9_9ROSI|nr:hypothetical protein K2173_015371 [Erythroxylum novogranatense]